MSTLQAEMFGCLVQGASSVPGKHLEGVRESRCLVDGVRGFLPHMVKGVKICELRGQRGSFSIFF